MVEIGREKEDPMERKVGRMEVRVERRAKAGMAMAENRLAIWRTERSIALPPGPGERTPISSNAKTNLVGI